jgi:hypothetical protein
MQKGEKVEYRNAAFEVLTPLSRGDRSLSRREYEQGVVDSIEQYTRSLENENQGLKETVKEVFARLQRVARSIDPEQAAESHRPEIIDLPQSSGKNYTDLLRKFIRTIE